SDPASIVCDGQLVMVNRNSPSSLSFPTYYEVQQHPSRPNRVFIDYWWTYNIQSNCFSNLGGHDYDWEHVIVQVDTEANKVISVTYFQHGRSEEHTSELQSRENLVCRLLLEKKKKKNII